MTIFAMLVDDMKVGVSLDKYPRLYCIKVII